MTGAARRSCSKSTLSTLESQAWIKYEGIPYREKHVKEVRARYFQKLSTVDNVDPYKIEETNAQAFGYSLLLLYVG